MMSYWMRLAGMLRPLLMAPGPTKAPVIVTESGELANFILPTTVAVPRPNVRAAMAVGAWINNMPAKKAGSGLQDASQMVRRAEPGGFNVQAFSFIRSFLPFV